MHSEKIEKLLATLPAEIRLVFEQILAILYTEFAEKEAAFAAREAFLLEQVADLQAKIDLNSRTSSKPPSSDVYEKPAPKNSRTKSGRSAGGQQRHKGESLKMTATPDIIEKHDVLCCEKCQQDLSNFPAEGYVKRQVLDIPPITQLRYTEHQSFHKTCNCGHTTQAKFPPGVDRYIQYGRNLKSFVAYLQDYQLLPYKRSQEFIKDLFGHDISQGTLFNMRKSTYNQLEDFEKELKALLCACVLAGFDETGMRVMTKLHWLHSCSTDKHAYYAIHEKRGEQAMNDIDILPQFEGIAIHDAWASYYKFACQHGLCNAHILRELAFIEQRYEQAWATAMIELLIAMKKAKENAIEKGKTKLAASTLAKYRRKYKNLLQQGFQDNPFTAPTQKKRGRPKKTKARNLLERLEKYDEDILRFLYDFKVPFDNNFSERDIRMMKLKQKISGCFRSVEGAKMFARVRSFIITAKKQKYNILEAFKDLFSKNEITAMLTKA